MKDKICPLLLATTPIRSSKKAANCLRDNCAWFYYEEIEKEDKKKEKVGFCSILKIAGAKIPRSGAFAMSDEDPWRK